MEYLITVDSGCDLSLDICNKYDIIPLFMSYEIEGESFTDTLCEEDILQFYNKIRGGIIPKTSQIAPLTYVDFWRDLLKDSECKTIVHISMSSGISGTYKNALTAVSMIKEIEPKAQIYVVDALMTSTGQGAFAIDASRLRKIGKTANECVAWLEKHKLEMNTFFTTNNLNYLHKGGRVSKTGAIFGTALKINPVLRLDTKGCLKVYDKVRGEQKTIEKIAIDTANTAINPEKQTLYVSHADNIEKAKIIANAITERVQFKNVVFNYIGTTIGTHTGADLVAVFFYGKTRTDVKKEVEK